MTWDGGGGDFNWGNRFNWNHSTALDPNTLPGSDDDAVIGNVGTTISIPRTVCACVRTLNSQAPFSITDPNAGLYVYRGATIRNTLLLAGGIVNLWGASEITNLTMSGGQLGITAWPTLAGDLTVPSRLTWTGGSIGGSPVDGAQPTLTLPAGSTLDIGGDGAKNLSGLTINHGGTASWSGGGTISVGGLPSLFRNQSGALFDVRNDVSFSFSGGQSMTFSNVGTFRKSAGPGTTTIRATPFENTGTVQVESGTLRLEGGGTSSGSFTVAEGASLNFSSFIYTLEAGATITGAGNTVFTGTVLDIAGNVTVSNLVHQQGNLEGTGNLTITNSLTWTGGTQRGRGTTTVSAGGRLLVSGPNDKFLQQRTLNNAGTATWTGPGNLTASDGARLANLAGAQFDMQTDAGLLFGGGALAELDNAGTFRKSAGAGAGSFPFVDLAFRNRGVVQVQGGTLGCLSYVQTAGVTTLAAGTALTAENGVEIQGGLLAGAGTVRAAVTNAGTVSPGVSPGTLTINGAYTQTATGILTVEIGGLTAGTQFDTLAVTGTVTLGGTLNVSLFGGFTPRAGDSFPVLTFAGRGGDFATRNGLTLGGGLTFTPVFNAGNLTLVVTPPPPTPVPGVLQFGGAAYTARENAGTAAITVTRTGGSDGSVTVVYTASGGAAPATDYTPAAGTVSFGPGETSKTFTLTLKDNDLVEGDRTVTLALSNPAGGATLGNPSTTVLTILDDELPQVADSPRPANLGLAGLAFAKSREQYTNLVTRAYRQYLQRDPEAAGLNGWTDLMLAGTVTEERLEAGFIGSREYIAKHGGQGRGWVVGMYQDLLGRTPAESEVSAWLDALAQGMPEWQVAFGFAASAEREGQRVQRNYRTYLDRDASPQEVEGYVRLFAAGAVTNQDIVATFISSPEYYASPTKGRGNKAVWIISVYEQVLFRTPSAGEVHAWLAVLN